MTNRISLFFAACILALPLTLLAGTWPGSTTPTNIGSALIAAQPTFEPSGIVWHSGRGTYIVVSDSGVVAELSTAGTVVNTWSASGNWEGVTLIDTSSTKVYLAEENRSDIEEFDLSTGALTGKTWSVASHIYPIGIYGFEALTWVPDGDHAYGTTVSGGLFYAGWQYNGDIYIFEPNLSTGAMTYKGVVLTYKGYTDLSDLDYNHDTDTLFAVYDGYDTLEEYDGAGNYTSGHWYPTPVSGAWEGVTFVDNCPTSNIGTLVLADDDGISSTYGAISTFGNYTVPCAVTAPVVTDADGDGVSSTVDCNDADTTISTYTAYYRDADGDGKGSTVSASFCAATAPTGYATNSLDCDDADASISSTTLYYTDVDSDGYGDPAYPVSLCASTAPSGYANNASDILYPNNRIEICNDGKDNDGDAFIDEANTLFVNRAHPVYSTYSAVNTGYVTALAPANPGAVRVTYTDGSCYDYTVFTTFLTASYVLKLVPGTSFYTLTRGSQTAALNALTGKVTITGAYPAAPKTSTKIWETPTHL